MLFGEVGVGGNPVWPCQLNYLPFWMLVVALATLDAPPPFSSAPHNDIFCVNHTLYICVHVWVGSLTLTVNVRKWQRYDRSRQSSGRTHTSSKVCTLWENYYKVRRWEALKEYKFLNKLGWKIYLILFIKLSLKFFVIFSSSALVTVAVALATAGLSHLTYYPWERF